MSNLDRLRAMPAEKLAETIKAIHDFPAYEYFDIEAWLDSDEEEMLPRGKVVLADIIIKTPDGHCAERVSTACVILEEDVRFFGQYYTKIFDIADDKIKSIPSDCIEVIEYE